MEDDPNALLIVVNSRLEGIEARLNSIEARLGELERAVAAHNSYFKLIGMGIAVLGASLLPIALRLLLP